LFLLLELVEAAVRLPDPEEWEARDVRRAALRSLQLADIG
jgi:hypothetical protein